MSGPAPLARVQARTEAGARALRGVPGAAFSVGPGAQPVRDANSARAVLLAGLPVLLESRADTAAIYLACIRARREGERSGPVLATSMNGHTIYEVSTRPETHKLFGRFSLNSMDGQPAVLWSRFWPCRFAERVATTDLVHDVITAGLEMKLRHYFLGGAPGVVEQAVQNLAKRHPGVIIAGARDGYFAPEDLPRVAYEIETSAADVVWVCMGVPREQHVAIALAEMLSHPGLIKTGGGLLDFLSGRAARAPGWMQAIGLEWLFRLSREPRRLFARYLISNPYALWRIVRTRPAYRRVCY